MTDDQDADVKRCPDCAEQVLSAARVCRYCGYRFGFNGEVRDAPARPGVMHGPQLDAPEHRGTGWKTWAVIILVAAVAWSAQQAGREEMESDAELSDSLSELRAYENAFSSVLATYGDPDSRGLALNGGSCSAGDSEDVSICEFREDIEAGEDLTYRYRIVAADNCFTGTLLEEPSTGGIGTPPDIGARTAAMRTVSGCL